MKALVTGANGFIGSNLVKILLERGWQVRSMVLEGTPLDFIEGLDTEIVYADITKPETLPHAVDDIDVVFHLAAIASDWGPRELFMKVNAEGTYNMLEASARARVNRFVQMSSVAVHAYRGHTHSDETAPRDCPEHIYYGRSKILAEDYVMDFHRQGKIEGVIIRPGLFPFGPNDTTSFYRLAQALEKGAFSYVNGGKAKVSTAYVENLVHGLELAARHKKAPGEVFIIADGWELTWRQLMEKFCEELGVKKPWLSLPYPVADLAAKILENIWKTFKIKGEPPVTRYRASLMKSDLYFVPDKAKRVLGYKPIVNFDTAVGKTVDWYKSVKGRYR